MEFVKNFTPSISPKFNSFSKKKHKKWVKMEKFTLLAKILHCRRHWRHWQIPPLKEVWSLWGCRVGQIGEIKEKCVETGETAFQNREWKLFKKYLLTFFKIFVDNVECIYWHFRKYLLTFLKICVDTKEVWGLWGGRDCLPQIWLENFLCAKELGGKFMSRRTEVSQGDKLQA